MPSARGSSTESLFAEERRNLIRKIVREKRRVNFSELHALVKVSPATLRRDLTDLEAGGEIIRVHGGVLDPGYMRLEISFDDRLLRHMPAKRAIAAKAFSLIPAGASVFVDAGSTCLEAGRMLLARKDLHVVSHSVALAAAALEGKADFLCVGGSLRRVSGALVGATALSAFASLKTDYALVGASGLDREGCYTTEVFEAEMKRLILKNARRRILLADESKWGEPSIVRFSEWADFTDWVTNKAISPRPPERQLKIHLATGTG